VTTNPTTEQQAAVGTALTPSSASAGSLLLSNQSMERLERIAEIMASGAATVPRHLQKSKGDCFAITLQSMQWGMNPFAVAQKTHLVNGTLGYEAQLVAAVINTSGVVKDRFHFEWFGDWTKIVGRFKQVESKTKKDDDGNFKKYIVPDWKQEDERGLGVRVWATLRGESEPRVLELLMTQARTRNSTLWTEDPKQQIAYLAQKRWARLYAPDVILGVYTGDELAEPGERFMGMVDEVGDTPPPPPPAPPPPKAYDQAKFDANFPEWEKVIKSGRKTAAAFIHFAETRGEPYTEAQKTKLQSVKVEKGAGATDVTPKGEQQTSGAAADPASALTYAVIADRIANAKHQDDLQALDEAIGAIADEQQRSELVAKAKARSDELPPF